MLFLHVAQLVMSFTAIHHLTGIIASIDIGGVHSIMNAKHALLGNAVCTPGQQAGATTLTEVATIVTNVEVTVKVVSGGSFVIGISIAAIMRMLSLGSDRRVATANAALTAAIVGLAIFFAANGIQDYLFNVFQPPC